MNVSGHRIGTAEVEGVLVDHVAVAESAVVPKPHDIKGEGNLKILYFRGIIAYGGMTQLDPSILLSL